MQSFIELNKILDKLLSPEGCPWDREQTLQTLRSTVLEEVHELIEAVNLDNDADIVGELGDLFFNVLFFCKLGEREGRFTMDEVLNKISEKLIRRHPHVFGESTLETPEEVVSQWELIKSLEKEHSHRKSAIDGIPHSLPSLALAYKLFGKSRKKEAFWKNYQEKEVTDEEKLGKALFELVKHGREKGIDPEQALRHYLANFSGEFRKWEDIHKQS